MRNLYLYVVAQLCIQHSICELAPFLFLVLFDFIKYFYIFVLLLVLRVNCGLALMRQTPTFVNADHPWMREDGDAPDKPLDIAVLTRMKQFRAMNKLKKLALKVRTSTTCFI